MARPFRVIDERSWLEWKVPRHLLRFLKDRTTDRKLRLWACAATAHRYAENEEVLAVVALVEAWADGDYPPGLNSRPRDGICHPSAWEAAYEGTLRALEKLSSSEKKDRYTRFQLAAVHDIFGNPFRPTALDASWLTPTVSSLARSAYEERSMPCGELDPQRLAVLSDCLEEAGCDDTFLLDHLRSPGPHVRGCWAVDLCLGLG